MPDLINPFADYGQLVAPSRYIRRSDLHQFLESRVIQPPGGGAAIIGSRRIGKSNLAHFAITVRREDLHSQRTIVLLLSLGTYDDPLRFFCDLVELCFNRLADYGWVTREIRQRIDEITERGVERFHYLILLEFFQELQRRDIRVIFVLEEFDRARELFRGEIIHYQRIRDLMQQTSVTFVTVSRDPVHVIEQKQIQGSTLAGVFDDRYVGMFSPDEVNRYFEHIASVGLQLAIEDRGLVMERCGGHPFLLDKLAFEIIEIYRRDGTLNIQAAIESTEFAFLRQYQAIVNHLKSRDLFEPLLNVLFGVPGLVPGEELRELKQYELIKVESNGRYSAFSRHFGRFLGQFAPPLKSELTAEELKVLHLVANGMTNKEIAKQLNKAETTVKSQLDSIYSKLSVDNRTKAVQRARELDLID